MSFFRKIAFRSGVRNKYETDPVLLKYFDRQKALDINQDIDMTKFTVIDLEMTGLNHKKDYILSISGHQIRDKSIHLSSSFEIFINNEISSTGVPEVHGILKEDIHRKGIRIEEALLTFLEQISDSIIIAHGSAIDLAFLNTYLKKYFNVKLLNYVIDTVTLVKIYEEGSRRGKQEVRQNRYALHRCCQRYGITQRGLHSSLDDAFATAELFLTMLCKLKVLKTSDLI